MKRILPHSCRSCGVARADCGREWHISADSRNDYECRLPVEGYSAGDPLFAKRSSNVNGGFAQSADSSGRLVNDGFVPQPGHSVSFGERLVLVEAAAEVVARLSVQSLAKPSV